MGLKKHILTGILAYFICVIYLTDFSAHTSPEFWIDGLDLIHYHGYKGEEHETISDDGWITKTHRIYNKIDKEKLPVLIVTGTHGSSPMLFANGPKHDYVYRFADEGLDIWITNYRGNKFSIPSENSSLSYEQLTNFGLHEQGALDLPKVIDHVIKVTGHQKIQLVTGSMGYIIVIALLDALPDYNDKINELILMAPGGPFTDQTLTFQKVAVYVGTTWMPIWNWLITLPREYFAYYAFAHPLAPFNCWDFGTNYLGAYSDGLSASVCITLLKATATGPWGGLFEHAFQMIAKRKYTMRDYGPDKNMKVYNQTTPKEYNLEKNVRVPIILFECENDVFLTEEGRELMNSMIPNVKQKFIVKPPFGHANFFFNAYIDKDFVNTLLDILKIKQ